MKTRVDAFEGGDALLVAVHGLPDVGAGEMRRP
jgi:hypothetical protein